MEIKIQQRLAGKLLRVFKNQESLLTERSEVLDDSPTKNDSQLSKKLPKKPSKKSRSISSKKGKLSQKSPKSPKKGSKDASFENSYFDLQIDGDSAESSFQELYDESKLEELQNKDPVKHFRLQNYLKFITPKDRELLREAMLS